MKKVMGTFFFFIALGINPIDLQFPAQEKKEQELVLKEEIRVVNVEVPVRVFYKGAPVKDLTKDDFKLYENKKLQKIHGFFVKRKRMVEINAEKKHHPRTFILVFQITDYNHNVKKAVHYFFEKILNENDRVMIFANNKSLNYPWLDNKELIEKEIRGVLKQESIKARMRLTTTINNIEADLNVSDFRRTLFLIRSGDSNENAHLIHVFLKKYLDIWRDYKKQYLTPNIDRYFYFSKFLENNKTEKWVLNFYQLELFPRIALQTKIKRNIREITSSLETSNSPFNNALARVIERILNRIEIELRVSDDFPFEEVSKLFQKVDATFHSFFMKSTRESFSNDFNYTQVVSNMERSLKSLAKVTGGALFTSNNLVLSLETVMGKEDYYYMLTYEPEDPDDKSKKIKVKVKNKKYKVCFDNNIRADYISEYLDKLEEKIKIPDIKIKNLSFKKKQLAFKIVDFSRHGAKNKMEGRIKIRVKLMYKDNILIYDQTKGLIATKNVMNISIPFNKLERGEYNILIEATDLFTNKNAILTDSIRVNN